MGKSIMSRWICPCNKGVSCRQVFAPGPSRHTQALKEALGRAQRLNIAYYRLQFPTTPPFSPTFTFWIFNRWQERSAATKRSNLGNCADSRSTLHDLISKTRHFALG
jgi:hypothetical protein